MIKVGDRVKVLDSSYTYCIYEEFILKYGNKYTNKFECGKTPKNEDVGIINAIGLHEDDNIPIYIVNIGEFSYVMCKKGFEKIEDEIKVALQISKIIKEEKYYIETNLGKFDVTESVLEILKSKGV